MSILQSDDHPDMYGPNVTIDEAIAERDNALERLREIEVDREVKASNLEKLVDMVLAHEAASDELVENTNAALEDMLGDAYEAARQGMLDLARGLKQ